MSWRRTNQAKGGLVCGVGRAMQPDRAVREGLTEKGKIWKRAGSQLLWISGQGAVCAKVLRYDGVW